MTTKTLPRGEQSVALTVFDGRLYLATTTRLWVLSEGQMTPVVIASEEGAGDTQVFASPDLGA